MPWAEPIPESTVTFPADVYRTISMIPDTREEVAACFRALDLGGEWSFTTGAINTLAYNEATGGAPACIHIPRHLEEPERLLAELIASRTD